GEVHPISRRFRGRWVRAFTLGPRTWLRPEQSGAARLAPLVPQLEIVGRPAQAEKKQRRAGEQAQPAAGHAEGVAAVDALDDLVRLPAERLTGDGIAGAGQGRGLAGRGVVGPLHRLP